MKNEIAEQLLERYSRGEATAEEKELLYSWYLKYKSPESTIAGEDLQEEYDLGLQALNSYIKKQHTVKLWPRIAVAAAMFIVLSVGSYLYISKTKSDQQLAAQLAQVIKPGSNKAYLVLADGKRIALTEAGNGKIATQAGISITKTADGQLVYTITDTNTGFNSELVYNTIETPKGGQYQVKLPDGTKVWLNAASSLKFPASFSKLKQRKVDLIGEAYFEVSKDPAKPFVVHSAKQDVEVLGTHFNINAYTDETEVKTTLLEGSVKINDRMLKPGQQSILSGDKIRIVSADVDMETAWKNGEFSFEGSDFKSVMRTVSRWYDVDVVYDYNPVNLHISAQISKFRSVEEVLKSIQATEDVNFKIEGRRVRVIK